MRRHLPDATRASDPAELPPVREVRLVSSYRIHQLEQLCEEHELTCDCELCLELLTLLGRGPCRGGADPDSMEDDDQPYFWNRRD